MYMNHEGIYYGIYFALVNSAKHSENCWHSTGIFFNTYHKKLDSRTRFVIPAEE